IRIAAIQAKPASEEFDALWAGDDVPHAVDLLEGAARGGATLAVFPELYPRVGEAGPRRPAPRPRPVARPGPAPARRPPRGNTATVIGPDGRILGRQGKCYPTQGEIDQGVVATKGYRAIETPAGRLGIVICADYAFFADGADALTDVDIMLNPAWWFALGAA